MMEEHGSFNRRAVDVIGGWSDSPDRVEFMGTGVGPYLAEPSGMRRHEILEDCARNPG